MTVSYLRFAENTGAYSGESIPLRPTNEHTERAGEPVPLRSEFQQAEDTHSNAPAPGGPGSLAITATPEQQQILQDEYPLLQAICRGMSSGRHHEAEDLAQIVAIKFLTQAHAIRKEGRIRSWLAAVAYRENINLHHKRGQDRSVPYGDTWQMEQFIEESPDFVQEDPLEFVLRSARNEEFAGVSQEIQRLMAHLPSNQARILEDTFIRGRTYSELQDEYGLLPNALAVLKWRALKNLRNYHQNGTPDIQRARRYTEKKAERDRLQDWQRAARTVLANAEISAPDTG